MKYEEWKEIYAKIVVDLQLDKSKDETAAEILNQLMNTYTSHVINTNVLSTLIKDNTIFVFGAAPCLEKDIKENSTQFKTGVLIAADGATSALLKYDLMPDIIVTDLDGVIADQLKANMKKAILIIHAHGDNIDVVQKTIPKIRGSFLGTIQTNPRDYSNVLNFGGFTDGDRAVFLADQFQPKKIILVGFDCTSPPGFYSFQYQKNKGRKKKKLEWCQRLLNQFSKNYVSFI